MVICTKVRKFNKVYYERKVRNQIISEKEKKEMEDLANVVANEATENGLVETAVKMSNSGAGILGFLGGIALSVGGYFAIKGIRKHKAKKAANAEIVEVEATEEN